MQFPNTPTDCTCPFCGHSVKIEPVSADYYRHPTLPVLYVAKCTECGEKYMVQYIEDEKFCRNCGADMRGEEHESC